MSQLIVGQALELLDRKYQFVIESPVESFMLDLQQFIKFLIYTVLIDIGSGIESGRRQPKPAIISEEEVISNINRLGNN
jgi:hypothetical protein